MDISDQIREIVSRIAGSKGLDIIEITYKRESHAMVLRVIVDKAGGVTMDECGQINRELGTKLDEANFIDSHYIIEVASPGLDRTLKERRDFEGNLGKDIHVSTYAPIEGENVFTGKLIGLSEGMIVIESAQGVTTEIPFDKIAKARLEFTF